ncbi:MAG TPA: hypothetical protein VLX60_10780 [Terriglobales bacterium]|nr:hypothetical protein [Terriglobales bacterium]
MKARSMVFVLSAVCIFLAWKLAARPAQQPQVNETLTVGPVVASDTDIQLLRQDVRAQKQKLIAQNLPMNESEAVKFWEVYNRYSVDLRGIYDEKFRLIKQYQDTWGSMSDAEALIYTRRWLELDAQASELRSKYVLDVSNALPGKKAATFFQLDRRIGMMIELQIASQLPLALSQDKP